MMKSKDLKPSTLNKDQSLIFEYIAYRLCAHFMLRSPTFFGALCPNPIK